MGKFIGLPIQTEWPNEERLKVKLLTPLSYIDKFEVEYFAPVGYITDGASIPGIFWSVIGQPLSPQTIEAAIIHDVYCNLKTIPYKRVHSLFAEMLKDLNVPFWKRSLMSFAVKNFGPKWDSTQV